MSRVRFGLHTGSCKGMAVQQLNGIRDRSAYDRQPHLEHQSVAGRVQCFDVYAATESEVCTGTEWSKQRQLLLASQGVSPIGRLECNGLFSGVSVQSAENELTPPRMLMEVDSSRERSSQAVGPLENLGNAQSSPGVRSGKGPQC
ncbi:hypothetical protein KC325_g171 [Hortaea werneckii]|nr:hypothetical protein KC325_g171 [Hortaea werneckii]